MRRTSIGVRAQAMIAILLVAGLPSAGRAAGGKPDLIVSSVTAPDAGEQGGRLPITSKVRNRGSGKARSSATVFYLSLDSKVGGDKKLAPTASVPVLAPGAASRFKTTVMIPSSIDPANYYVVACGDGKKTIAESNERNNCRVSLRTVTVAAPPSSHELIEEAVASGSITEEQGLIYQVFSDFGDARLPARFEAPPNGLDHGALGEVAERWDALSPTAQETLKPFLIPPFYPGSYWSPAPSGRMTLAQTTGGQPWCSGSTDLQPLFNTWSHVDTAGGEVRIWWLASNTADAATATHLAAEVENKILPALTSLMGRSLKSDDGGLCDGGSSAMDIALVPASTATTFADGSCGANGTSAHMLFPNKASSAGWKGLDPYLAHEIMHALQFAMPVAGSCATYKWLREATAQWVQDYVTDPAYGIGVSPDDTEWQAAPIYMNNTEVSYDVDGPPKNHDYGGYLLPFWAVRRSGPGFVRDVWANAASNGPLEAVDKALPGGFHDTWADFTLANFNHGPVRDYKDWDGLTASPKLAAEGTVPLDAGIGVKTDIPYLASRYYRFDFARGVKLIHFVNPFVGNDAARVRAIITMSDGSQRIEDWSDKAEIKFCRDLPNEDIREVYVIISNRSTDKSITLTDEFEVYGEKQGCVCKAQGARTSNGEVEFRISQAASSCPGLTGTFTETVTRSTSQPTLNGSGTSTVTITLALKAEPDDPETDYPEGQNAWEDAGTSVSVEGSSRYVGTDGQGCSLTQEETQSGGTVTHASAFADDERTTLRVWVSYTYDWTGTNTFGGTCAAGGTATGSDTVDGDLDIDAEGDGSGAFTYHYEYHSDQPGSSYNVEANGSFSVG